MIEPKTMLKKIIKIINFPGAKDTGILKQIKMSVHCLIFLVHELHQYCCQCGQFDFKDVCIF